jgi:hypothetical protein
MCMFCRSLFVILSFFFWSLCCLFFFDLRILITPLVSSNSSYGGSFLLISIFVSKSTIFNKILQLFWWSGIFCFPILLLVVRQILLINFFIIILPALSVDGRKFTLPGHLSSPPVFSRVRVTRSLVLCVCFVDRCLSFCPFSFGHCVVCSSSYQFLSLNLLFSIRFYNCSDGVVFFVFPFYYL